MSSLTNFFFRKIPLFKFLPDLFHGPFSGGFYGIFNLFRMNKYFRELVCQYFFICESQEGFHKENAFLFQIFHVVLDIFRIGRHQRTIIVIAGTFRFISLIRNTRIEDEVLSLLD